MEGSDKNIQHLVCAIFQTDRMSLNKLSSFNAGPGQPSSVYAGCCPEKKYICCLLGWLVGGDLIYDSDLELRPR